MKQNTDLKKVEKRPNEITKEKIKELKKEGVKIIELEAWATNDYILKRCNREYTFKDIKKASKLIKWYGLKLGFEVMVGLPDTSKLDELRSAKELAKLKPKEVKISPIVITKGSNLEEEIENGEYKPLTLSQSVERCKEMLYLFSRKKVEVIKVENKQLENSEEILHGSYHSEFTNLVNDSVWYDSIVDKIKKISMKVKEVKIKVNFADMNNVVGYKKSNVKKIKETYDVEIIVETNNNIKQGKCELEIIQTYDEYIEKMREKSKV